MAILFLMNNISIQNIIYHAFSLFYSLFQSVSHSPTHSLNEKCKNFQRSEHDNFSRNKCINHLSNTKGLHEVIFPATCNAINIAKTIACVTSHFRSLQFKKMLRHKLQERTQRSSSQPRKDCNNVILKEVWTFYTSSL